MSEVQIEVYLDNCCIGDIYNLREMIKDTPPLRGKIITIKTQLKIGKNEALTDVAHNVIFTVSKMYSGLSRIPPKISSA